MIRLFIKCSLIDSEHINILAKYMGVSSHIFSKLMKSHTFFLCYKRKSKLDCMFTGLYVPHTKDTQYFLDSESFIQEIEQMKLLELL